MANLYIIDGMALAYRGHFAFIRAPLKNSRGMTTSAVYSFLTTLLKLIQEEEAHEVVAVFDSDRETFRKTLYPEYKAHRPPMPDELKEQIPYLFRLLEALAVPSLQIPGVEADDIVGTLAKAVEARGDKAFILSKDKDFAQLVNENIIMIDPKMQGEKTLFSGVREITEKFGVPPEKIIDYLALMGDASDNIPGVPKVGPKTAVELITRFGSLDGIYAALGEITQKALKKNLEENRENAYLSRKLVTIKTDVEVPQGPFRVGETKKDDYTALLRELEFNALLKQAESRHAPAAREVRYETVDTAEALAAFIRRAEAADTLAIDTETDGLDSRTAKLAGISLSIDEAEAVYLPIGHTAGNNLDIQAVRRLLGPVLVSERIMKAGHNLKFDLAVLANHGLPVCGPCFDTMIAAYVLNPGVRQYSLDACVLDRFSQVMQDITELIGGRKSEQIPFTAVEVTFAARYSCADADFTLRLKRLYEKELREKNLDAVFSTLEMPLLPVLLAMEKQGIHIDGPFLRELSLEYDKTLTSLHADIVRAAGREFNFNSPKQLQEILYNEMKIKPTRKVKTGFSTDADALEALAGEHELPRLILVHRKFTKLKSTYVDALPLDADSEGLVHTSFNQTITATGRLSSSDPNLQNIPVRTEEGREIRKAFIPRRKENILISGDYSQIELRILAHISSEPALIEAFVNDEDVHRKTASLLFGTLPGLVSPEQRAIAKTVNFGIIYGQGAFGLSQQIHVSQGEAREFIDNYFLTYPAIRRYMDATVAFAREKGFVETLFGRRRYLPEINSTNRQSQAFAERIAVNTPIQGTAADLIKKAMIRLQKRIDDKALPALMLLQVHDELVLECAESDADRVVAELRCEMEGAAALAVPLKADIGKGRNWLEAH